MDKERESKTEKIRDMEERRQERDREEGEGERDRGGRGGERDREERGRERGTQRVIEIKIVKLNHEH